MNLPFWTLYVVLGLMLWIVLLACLLRPIVRLLEWDARRRYERFNRKRGVT